MTGALKRFVLPLAASLTLFLAACADTGPSSKRVAVIDSNEGFVDIQIRQQLQGRYQRGGREFDFVAFGTAPRGFSWKTKGAIVTQRDALSAARSYCRALGSRIAPGHDRYISNNAVAAGVYFNCR